MRRRPSEEWAFFSLFWRPARAPLRASLQLECLSYLSLPSSCAVCVSSLKADDASDRRRIDWLVVLCALLLHST